MSYLRCGSIGLNHSKNWLLRCWVVSRRATESLALIPFEDGMLVAVSAEPPQDLA